MARPFARSIRRSPALSTVAPMKFLARVAHVARPVLVVGMAVAGAFASRPNAARASACPQNQIILSGVNVFSTRAALDTTGVNALGGYDLEKGQLSSSVTFND